MPKPRKSSSGIPIPSFASIDSGQELEKRKPSSIKDKRDEKKNFIWDVDSLLLVESALQTFLAQQHKKNINSTSAGKKKDESDNTTTTITLEDFYKKVAKKLQLSTNIASATAIVGPSNAAAGEAVQSSLALTQHDQLLLDLLRVTSPSLLKLLPPETNENHVTKSSWRLKIVSGTSNRMQELRRLASTTAVTSMDKRNRIFRQLQDYKKELSGRRLTVLAAIQATVPQKIDTDSILPKAAASNSSTAPTTLTERVAARAQAKMELKQEISLQHTGNNIKLLLRVADALWAHSRQVRVRQVRLQALSPDSTSKNSTAPCVMTLKDVVQICGKQVSSRKQVVAAMAEIQRRAPAWIVFSDSSNSGTTTGKAADMGGTVGKANNAQNGETDATTTTNKLTKNTTVWIHVVEDYTGTIRPKLGGTSIALSSSSVTALSLSLKRKPASSSETVSSSAMESKLSSKSPLPATSATKKLSLKLERKKKTTLLPKTTSTIIRSKSTPNPSSAAARSLFDNRDADRATLKSSKKRRPKHLLSLDHTGEKRSSPPLGGDDTLLPIRKRSKSTQDGNESKLRINDHLIMTGADYDGGQVLSTSTESSFESPRGLKRLMSEMNAGNRI